MDGKKISHINWWSEGARVEPVRSAEPAFPVSEEVPVVEPAVLPEPEPEAQPMQPTQQQPTQGVPFIQPLVVVPYVSQDQPIYYYDASGRSAAMDSDMSDVPSGYYEDVFGTDVESAEEDRGYARSVKTSAGQPKRAYAGAAPVEKKKSKFNVGAFLCLLFGIVYVLALFDWKSIAGVYLYNDLTPEGLVAFDVIKNFVTDVLDNGFTFSVDTTLLPILLAAGVVFAVITLLMGLFTVAGRTPIGCKIFAVIAFVINAGTAGFALFKVYPDMPKAAINGYYILAGIALVMCVFMLIARRRRIR